MADRVVLAPHERGIAEPVHEHGVVQGAQTLGALAPEPLQLGAAAAEVVLRAGLEHAGHASGFGGGNPSPHASTPPSTAIEVPVT
jgi:hypothetical protein